MTVEEAQSLVDKLKAEQAKNGLTFQDSDMLKEALSKF
jgi:hypothetical protein